MHSPLFTVSFLIYRMWRSKISNQKAVIGVESRDNRRVARNIQFRLWWGLVNILFPRIQITSPFSTLLSLIWCRTHSSTFWFLSLLFSLPLLYLIQFPLVCDSSYGSYIHEPLTCLKEIKYSMVPREFRN